jgi:hypothetical protein
MNTIIKTGKIDGKPVEVREESYGKQRYWVLVDGTALFQRGRMRLRTFTTVEAAWEAARGAITQITSRPRS